MRPTPGWYDVETATEFLRSVRVLQVGDFYATVRVPAPDGLSFNVFIAYECATFHPIDLEAELTP
jgi:hypothetical protein